MGRVDGTARSAAHLLRGPAVPTAIGRRCTRVVTLLLLGALLACPTSSQAQTARSTREFLVARGSNFYAVWTRQQQDVSNPVVYSPGRDFHTMFGAPGDDVLLFKGAYWMGK